MKIAFRTSRDRKKCKILFNDWYIGVVKLNVWTQKWTMYPSFDMSYNLIEVSHKKYDSAYKAGKEMVDLYIFLFPPTENNATCEFGFSLEEVVSFLKTRE